MPLNEVKKNIVRSWLQKADEDIALLEYLLKNDAPYFTAIAYHGQQAAEKYLKAVLTFYDVSFAKTHDMALLLDLLAGVDSTMAEELDRLVELTPYAVESRYPGDFPEVNKTEAETVACLARMAAAAAISILSDKPS